MAAPVAGTEPAHESVQSDVQPAVEGVALPAAALSTAAVSAAAVPATQPPAQAVPNTPQRPRAGGIEVTSDSGSPKSMDVSFEEKCGICLDTLRNGSDEVHTTRCSHSFHLACINSWKDKERAAHRSSTCPMCRTVSTPVNTPTASASPAYGRMFSNRFSPLFRGTPYQNGSGYVPSRLDSLGLQRTRNAAQAVQNRLPVAGPTLRPAEARENQPSSEARDNQSSRFMLPPARPVLNSAALVEPVLNSAALREFMGNVPREPVSVPDKPLSSAFFLDTSF